MVKVFQRAVDQAAEKHRQAAGRDEAEFSEDHKLARAAFIHQEIGGERIRFGDCLLSSAW